MKDSNSGDPPARLTDEELVSEIRGAPEGDLRAFEVLLGRYQQRVVANCRYLTRSADDAEDLAQEVFLKTFYGLQRFEARASFRTWLYRIKANHSMNFIRKRGDRVFVGVDELQPDSDGPLAVTSRAQAKVESAEARVAIEQVLDEMNDTLRLPLVMRDMDQMSYQEIAETLGLGLSAVKMRIKRAREEFRQRYAALREDPATEAST